MNQFVVYDSPADFPGLFVVRRWEIRSGWVNACEARVANTLEAAREVVPPGMYRLPRFPDDDPKIVEVWL
jgi:hypothetical protein